MSTRYFESFAPGRGRLTPRSALDSDAPRIDLDGAWAFRFSPALRPEPDGFEDPEFDDGSWDRLPVPAVTPLVGRLATAGLVTKKAHPGSTGRWYWN